MASRLDGIANWETIAQNAGFHAETMACFSQVTPRQLHRFFVRKFGINPRNWIQNVRFRLAREHLAQGKSLKEAAHLVGLGHPSSLSHLLRRINQ